MSWLVESQVNVQRYTIWPVPHSRAANLQRCAQRKGHDVVQVVTRQRVDAPR
jgi:hypothetical protein